MNDVGLYVHVPFCPSKCGYCDFYSRVPAEGQIEPLVDAMLAELDAAVDGRGVRVATIFVGGGTPTFLPPRPLARLFERLGRYARQNEVCEFSVETNPGCLDDDKAAILRAAGVNRISMGAQSFHESELRALDRIHHPDQIRRSAELVHRVGFEHFNLDLIFGIPGQGLSSWSDSLRQAVDLGPDHLACYGLTYEPGTPLDGRARAGMVARMADDLEAKLYTFAIEYLNFVGLTQYEISNFARPGGQCRHNLRYWHNQPGLGIGPAAASYFEGSRWRNVPDTEEYIVRIRSGQSPAVEAETLDPLQRAGETAMLMLRLVEGLRCGRFQELTGLDPHTLFGETITRHQASGLLVADADSIALTPAGRLVADSVIADFVNPQQVA